MLRQGFYFFQRENAGNIYLNICEEEHESRAFWKGRMPLLRKLMFIVAASLESPPLKFMLWFFFCSRPDWTQGDLEVTMEAAPSLPFLREETDRQALASYWKTSPRSPASASMQIGPKLIPKPYLLQINVMKLSISDAPPWQFKVINTSPLHSERVMLEHFLP